MIYDLTSATVSTTYGRIVQVVVGSPDTYYDGFGNLLNLGPGTYSVGPVGPTGPTGSNGTSVYFAGEWDDMMLYSFYDIVSYNGNTYLCIDALTPGPSYSSPDLDSIHWTIMAAGITGSAGPQGPIGPIGPTGSSVFHYTTGVTTSSYIITLNDNPTQYFGVSYSTPVTITIPDYTSDGKVVIVKDESGNAYSQNITINATKIDQSNQAIIGIDNGSITMMWRVNTWWII